MTSALPDALPYGIRQIMLTPYLDAQGTQLANTSYPLPVAMTLGFSESEQFDELRGDDILVAVHGRGPEVDWSLGAGGLPIMAWSIISGAMVIEEGVAPMRQVRLRKSGDDVRPYFRIDGRVICDSGGNIIARIYRCKVNGKIQGDQKGGAFMTSNIDGIGIPMVGDSARWLYEIIQNETDSAIGTTPEANPGGVPMNLNLGAVTSTTIAISWDAVPSATAYVVQTSHDNGVTWVTQLLAAGGAPTTNHTVITGLTLSTTYQLRVAATVASVTGDFCSPVIATTPAS
jgi:hypothetical protein